MKVAEIKKEISAVAESKGLTAVQEYSTEDGTRIDLAILGSEGKLLAVEFESTYKWIHQRLLYNCVKVHRGGFGRVLFVYPFSAKGIDSSWIMKFARDGLGLDVRVVKPSEALEEVSRLLSLSD